MSDLAATFDAHVKAEFQDLDLDGSGPQRAVIAAPEPAVEAAGPVLLADDHAPGPPGGGRGRRLAGVARNGQDSEERCRHRQRLCQRAGRSGRSLAHLSPLSTMRRPPRAFRSLPPTAAR